MRIGFDCTYLAAGYVGGASTFAKGLLKGLVCSRGEHTIQIYLFEQTRRSFGHDYDHTPGVEFIVIPDTWKMAFDNKCLAKIVRLTKALTVIAGTRSLFQVIHNFQWRRAAGIIGAHSDFTIYPLSTLPTFNLNGRKLLCLHDIQQVHFPQFFTFVELNQRRIRYWLSARQADYIQASSQFMKKDFLTYFPFLKPENLVVISEGVDTSFFIKSSSGEIERTIHKFNLPPDYILYPAQLWPHKNHLRLLSAVEVISKKYKNPISLVLTGAEYGSAKEVKQFIEERGMANVFYLGSVAREDLLALYSGAKLLAMPSLFESSSLPVLEAMSVGIPVASSRIPALVEQAETYSIDLFDPEDVDDMAGTIFDLYSHPERASDQVRRNSARIAQSDWAHIAAQYISFMESRSRTHEQLMSK